MTHHGLVTITPHALMRVARHFGNAWDAPRLTAYLLLPRCIHFGDRDGLEAWRVGGLTGDASQPCVLLTAKGMLNLQPLEIVVVTVLPWDDATLEKFTLIARGRNSRSRRGRRVYDLWEPRTSK